MVEDGAEARTVGERATRDAGGLDWGCSSKGKAEWSNSGSILQIKSMGFADKCRK